MTYYLHYYNIGFWASNNVYDFEIEMWTVEAMRYMLKSDQSNKIFTSRFKTSTSKFMQTADFYRECRSLHLGNLECQKVEESHSGLQTTK